MKNLKDYEDFILEKENIELEEVNEFSLPDLSDLDLANQIFWWISASMAGITVTGFIASIGMLGYEMLKFALGEVKEKISSTEKGKEFFALLDSIFTSKNKEEAKGKIQQLGEYVDVLSDISKMGKTEEKVVDGIKQAIEKAKK